MQELLTLSKEIHVGVIITTALVILYLYFRFLFEKDYIRLTKFYEKFSLVYFFFLSTLAFTGLIVFTVLKFSWSLKVVLMILAIFHMIVTSVKLHRFLKISSLKDKKTQIDFKEYGQKKYMLDLIVLITVGFISYAIHI